MKRLGLICVLAAGVVAALWITKAPSGRSSSHDFRLDTWDHGRFYLHEQRGKAVVLMFWDTQCVICKQEMAWLRQVREQGPNDLTVAAICTDPENSDTLNHIAETMALPYPILLDPGGTLARRYGIQVYPTTVVLDQRGQPVATVTGFSETLQRQLQRRMERVLAL